MGNANLNPWTEAKVNTKNPDRGPVLIVGEKDHTVPWALARAAYKRQRRNPGVTEIVRIANRGHALTIDHGWREVAQTALDFVTRFAAQFLLLKRGELGVEAGHCLAVQEGCPAHPGYAQHGRLVERRASAAGV